MIGISELIPPEPEEFTLHICRVCGTKDWCGDVTWCQDTDNPGQADCNGGKTNTSEKRARKSSEGWLTKYREANIDVRRKMLGWRPLTSGEKMLLT